MKTFFDENTDKNFKTACLLSEETYNDITLIKMLETGDLIQKQYAALNISTINDKKDAQILLNNLTGVDGKVREAVAFKINDILCNNVEKVELFSSLNLLEVSQILANATIDINANICKSVLCILDKLKSNDNFAKLYTANIIEKVFSTYEELDKFIYKDKKYVINKQLFKLYWCLEALKGYIKYVDNEQLEKILIRASKEEEYTIREKVAQILVKLDNDKYLSLKKQLYNDTNYYVRNVMKDIVIS